MVDWVAAQHTDGYAVWDVSASSRSPAADRCGCSDRPNKQYGVSRASRRRALLWSINVAGQHLSCDYKLTNRLSVEAIIIKITDDIN